MFSAKLLVSCAVLILAYFYSDCVVKEWLQTTDDFQLVLDAWQSKIDTPGRRFQNVSIGLNACVDLIVNATALLRALNVDPAAAKDHSTIGSLQDLQEAFHHYFKLGSAAERFFSDPELFNKIVATASAQQGAQWYIGGNAALIAQKMATTFPDIQVSLSGPVGPRLRELLHQDIVVPPDTLSTPDPIHLILEYGVGQRWGRDTESPVATRFITSHDTANAELTGLTALFEQTKHSQVNDGSPRLLVLSGLHMLDGQPGWDKRILSVVEGLRAVPKDVAVHLELASMANAELLGAIAREVLSHVDSLGLNEQELSFLSRVMGGPHQGDIFTTGEDQPQIDRVADTLLWLLTEYGSSRLTRVHFHSLTFHILATNPRAWTNQGSAVAAGTRIASYQACDTTTLDETLTEVRIPKTFTLHRSQDRVTFDPSSPVHEVQVDGFQLAFSPVLVCKNPLKTVGLGDAISATGLMFSHFIV